MTPEDQKSMKVSGIVEFSSISKGYQFTNSLLSLNSIEVIEATFLSPGKFFVLFNGSPKDIHAALELTEKFRDVLLDSASLGQLDEKILNSLYGLSRIQANPDGLLILETATLCSGLKTAQKLTSEAKLLPIEIRPGREIGGKCLLFFSGPGANLEAGLSIAQQTLKNSSFSAELVLKPNEKFLRYFQLFGESK